MSKRETVLFILLAASLVGVVLNLVTSPADWERLRRLGRPSLPSSPTAAPRLTPESVEALVRNYMLTDEFAALAMVGYSLEPLPKESMDFAFLKWREALENRDCAEVETWAKTIAFGLSIGKEGAKNTAGSRGRGSSMAAHYLGNGIWDVEVKGTQPSPFPSFMSERCPSQKTESLSYQYRFHVIESNQRVLYIR